MEGGRSSSSSGSSGHDGSGNSASSSPTSDSKGMKDRGDTEGVVISKGTWNNHLLFKVIIL